MTSRTPLSSYAFSEYGHDAKLYNGIYDLEELSRKLAEALYVHHDTSTCMWCNRYNDNYKHPCKAKAALAQYTAHADSQEVKG